MIYNIHHLDNLQNDMANDMESWVLSIVEVRGEKLLIEWNMFSGMRELDLPNISLHALKLKRSTPFEDLSGLFWKEHIKVGLHLKNWVKHIEISERCHS